MPDKETRSASHGPASPFSPDADLLAQRRPVTRQSAAKNPVAPQPQPEDARFESVDPATQVSVESPGALVPTPVPDGVDPLIAPLIDQLESKSLTRIPRPPVSPQPFDGNASTQTAAEKISRTLGHALAPREIQRRLAAAKQRARKAHLDVKTVKPEPIEKVSAELADAELVRLMSDYNLAMDNALSEGILAKGWLGTTHRNLASARKRLTSRKGKKGPAPDPAVVEGAMAQERAAEALRLTELIKKTRNDWVDSQQLGVQSKIKALLVPHEELKPQRQVPESERVPLYEDAPAKFPKVAPEMRAFLDAVTEQYPGLSLSNRRDHGGGKFKGAGFSVDITLPRDKITERRFYDENEVLTLLEVMEDVAVEMDARWRVLYDDFRVEDKFNPTAERGRVTSQSRAEPHKLNFHGPGELLLHLHLDVSLPPPAAPEAKPPEPKPSEAAPAEAPSPAQE